MFKLLEIFSEQTHYFLFLLISKCWFFFSVQAGWCIFQTTVKPRLSGMHLSKNTAIRTFFSGTKKSNIILLHLAGNPCFRNRTVVLGTKPCFTMTKSLCYPDTRQSVIDFKANWHYKHCVAYPCLIGDSITFVNR